MANKFDRQYLYINIPDQNKINAVLSKSDEMDTQDLLQFSMINKFPLYVVNNKDNNNLIHLGILNKNSEFNILNYIKFLVQQQVNPDQPNKDNQTPLHLACQKQYLTIVKFLLEQCVDINYQDNNGATPLHYLLTGDIKPWEEKEVKEFIIPNPKNKKDRSKLIEFKKIIWNKLKDKPFFEALRKTIKYYIENNEEIKIKKQEYLQKLSNTNNDNKEHELITLTTQNDIQDIILTMWNKFANNDNIEIHLKKTNSLVFDNSDYGIIKNGNNIKQIIKNKLKIVMKNSDILITNFNQNIEETDLNYELSNLLNEVLYNNVITIIIENKNEDTSIKYPYIIKISDANKYGISNFSNFENFTFLKNTNIIELLTKSYKNKLAKNANDFADNIIDLDNLSFIGGSRKISIDNKNYDKLKKLLEDSCTKIKKYIIEKKVIFILLITYLKGYNFEDSTAKNNHNKLIKKIINFDHDNYNDFFDKELKENFIFNYSKSSIYPKYDAIINISKEIYKNIFIDKINNVGPIIYYQYIHTILQHTVTNDNLTCSLHLLFYRLVLALNNDPINLEKSLNHVFKIDYFKSIHDEYDNKRICLANWTAKLFDIEDEDKLIVDIKNTNNKNIVNDILNYYELMPIKFPKLYLLDLVYYILDSKKHKYIIEIYDKIKDTIKNIDSFDLPPSLQGYRYITFENNIDINYLNSKLIESIELGLLFNGCLPNLMKPINDNSYFILKLNKQKDIYFIFNPLDNHDNNSQDPELFNDINNINTPLPFNYYYNKNTIIYSSEIKKKYFLYIENRYRPPYEVSVQKLLESQFNSFNEILKNLLKNSNNIIKTLLSTKQKISEIYYNFYIKSKLIINKQEKLKEKIIKLDKTKQIELFDFNNFTINLNSINSLIFIYYYLVKNSTYIPEFLYYKLGSKQYKLFKDNDPLKFNNDDLVGGSLELNNLDFMNEFYFGFTEIFPIHFNFTGIDTDNAGRTIFLPPSLEDNLDDFYQLNKIKFIIENIEDIIKRITSVITTKYINNQKDITYFKIAKLIEEIIKNYSELIVKQEIYNKLSEETLDIKELFDINAQISIVTKNTIENLEKVHDKIEENIHNFYKFSDPNVSKKCDFIIYPNEYTNTNLLIQKYCIKIDEKIIPELINQNAHPYLLDNNNVSCLNSVISTFNYNILNKYLEIIKSNCYNDFDYNDEIKYIIGEIDNHINKIINCPELEEIDKIFNAKFIDTQYEEIKLLILSDESYGNNLFYKLKNSFNICFYIMNEYLTDSLWCLNDKFVKEDFDNIIKLLGKPYEEKSIFTFYLYDFANKNSESLFNDDKSLLIHEMKTNLEKENEKLEEDIEKEENDKYKSVKNKIFHKFISNKCNSNSKEKLENNKKILANIKSESDKYKKRRFFDKKDLEIIINYDKLIRNEYGVYSSIWELLFSDKKNLNESYNLSLIKILKFQCKNKYDEKIEKYYNHISNLAYSYFETTKFLENNNVMKFIYELLVHLTKTQLCFGIEILVRKTLYNHLISYISFEPIYLNNIIEMILEKNYIYEDNELSFKKVLYDVLPKKFVKNSVNMFDNLDEKVNFEPQTVLELLKELFDSLRKFPQIDYNEILLENLNKNIANYFDLFISRTIKNWYVVCENILKFVINQERMTKTLGLLKYEKVATVTVLCNDEVLVCLRGVKDHLEGTIISQGGRVDPNETFEMAAIREAKEEAGITIEEKHLKLYSEEFIDNKHFKNYYVKYDTKPEVTGPDIHHKEEIKVMDKILDIETTNNIAWIPINKILNKNEKTYFTENLKKIEKIILK